MTGNNDKPLSYTMGYSIVEDMLRIDLNDPFVKSTTTWIINTREQITRDALIAMGWTPPPESVGQTPKESV